MAGLLTKIQVGPIGVDIGSRSVKLLQFDGQRKDIRETAHWDLPPDTSNNTELRDQQIVDAIKQASQGHNFRGKKAAFCLGADNLFVQNIRVAKAEGNELTKIVNFEAAGRVPFPGDEAEIHYVEADDVRQGDSVRREVILLACHRPALARILGIADKSGLQADAIDVEPAAMLRCYRKQFRRDSDQQRRVMFVNIGASTTMTVIAKGSDAMFIKYIDIGGKHFDEAVAKRLKMPLPDAVALRRHNGDRRADQRDAEITRSISESTRPVLESLGNELSLCIRYYSVTFRGQPLSQIVFGGDESSQSMVDWAEKRFDFPCELGNPLRSYQQPESLGRLGQWDVAAGLALRGAE
jgi:type IV pilus assembly protein PilM